MPPLPTIPDVVRVTFAWNTVNGVTPRNVIHIRTALTTDADIMSEIVSAVGTGDGNLMYVAMHSSFAIDHVDILKLDGSAATSSFIGLSTLFETTGGSGELVPEAAMLLKLSTAVGGPRGRGRQYIGPLAESACANGFLTGITLSTVADAWVDFSEALVTSSLSHLCVASYFHADSNDVIAITPRSYIATQRRRLLQTRP